VFGTDDPYLKKTVEEFLFLGAILSANAIIPISHDSEKSHVRCTLADWKFLTQMFESKANILSNRLPSKRTKVASFASLIARTGENSVCAVCAVSGKKFQIGRAEVIVLTYGYVSRVMYEWCRGVASVIWNSVDPQHVREYP